MGLSQELDASATKGVLERRSLGKVRYVRSRGTLGAVRAAKLRKIAGTDNTVDLGMTSLTWGKTSMDCALASVCASK